MSWIWVTAVVGSLTGTAMAYHRRLRGVPGPPPGLPWRANRHENPPRMTHQGTPGRYSGLPVLSVNTHLDSNLFIPSADAPGPLIGGTMTITADRVPPPPIVRAGQMPRRVAGSAVLAGVLVVIVVVAAVRGHTVAGPADRTASPGSAAGR
jgi:hypothetical protein